MPPAPMGRYRRQRPAKRGRPRGVLRGVKGQRERRLGGVSRRAALSWKGDAEADGAVGGPGQQGLLGFGDVAEVDGGLELGEAGVFEDAFDRAAGDQDVEVGVAEDGERRVAGALLGGMGLAFAAAREALLGLAARLGLALDVGGVGLGSGDAAVFEDADRVRALAGEEDRDAARFEGVVAQVLGRFDGGSSKSQPAGRPPASVHATLADVASFDSIVQASPSAWWAAMPPLRAAKFATHRGSRSGSTSTILPPPGGGAGSRRSSAHRSSLTSSDVEPEGPKLVAAVVGDLVRAPRRDPHPVDLDVVARGRRPGRWSAPRGTGPR